MNSARLGIHHHATRASMTAAFVALHITAHAESLSTSRVRALERLLAGVRMTVDFQARRSRKSLVARLADVAVLGLRVSCL